MTTQTLTRTCAACGDDFVPIRWTSGTYCGKACQRAAHRNQSIVPAETKGIRKDPMTMTEFDVLYLAIRDELIRAGLPLVRDDLLACAEKASREAEAARTAGAGDGGR